MTIVLTWLLFSRSSLRTEYRGDRFLLRDSLRSVDNEDKPSVIPGICVGADCISCVVSSSLFSITPSDESHVMYPVEFSCVSRIVSSCDDGFVIIGSFHYSAAIPDFQSFDLDSFIGHIDLPRGSKEILCVQFW